MTTGPPLPPPRASASGRIAFPSITEGSVVEEELLSQLTGLRPADDALQTLLGALPGSIVVADEDGRIVFAEHGIEQLSGYPATDLEGRPVESLVPPEQRGAHVGYRSRFSQSPRVRPMGAELDIALRHRDGHDVAVDISLSPIEVEGHTYVVAALREASERRAAEEAVRLALEREREASAKLREVAEIKNAFIRAVSHELRTPLTVVHGLASTLQERLHDLRPDQLELIAERLARNAHRLNALLGDLLDVDRLTRGTISPRRRTVDLGMLAREVVENTVPDGTPVHLLFPGVLEAEVDPAQVERILENLVANAIKHTPAGTPVTVGGVLDPETDEVLLFVDDAGPGVSPELRAAIFESFVQGSSGSHAPGTGIGLSLVKQFAELHGGRAWVEDARDGGSSFRVLLPPAPRGDLDVVGTTTSQQASASRP